jgi:hypothetical protein
VGRFVIFVGLFLVCDVYIGVYIFLLKVEFVVLYEKGEVDCY